MNLAVRTSPAAVMIETPKPTASDEPNESVRIMPPLWRSIPFFTSVDHITPDETTSFTDEMSQRPGFSSSAFSMGLANASPTITSELAW